MPTEARKRARDKYIKDKVTKISIEFYPPDADIIEYLKTLDNKQGYIKQLIRDDFKKKSK